MCLNLWSPAGGATGEASGTFRKWGLPIGSESLRVGLEVLQPYKQAPLPVEFLLPECRCDVASRLPGHVPSLPAAESSPPCWTVSLGNREPNPPFCCKLLLSGCLITAPGEETKVK